MIQLDFKTVKTRKPHKCWGCEETYPIGTEMECITSKDGGEFITAYWCKICQAVIVDTDLNGEEFAQGEIKKEMPEEWESARKEIFMRENGLGDTDMINDIHYPESR